MFPTEWKVAESMELDLLTDILYIFFVNEPFNGFVTVRTNDFQYDNFNQFVFYRRNQPWTPIRLNVTRINRFTGKMIVANFADARSMFQVISEINLLGCSKGKEKIQKIVFHVHLEHIQTYMEVILVIYVDLVTLH